MNIKVGDYAMKGGSLVRISEETREGYFGVAFEADRMATQCQHDAKRFAEESRIARLAAKKIIQTRRDFPEGTQ